MLTFYPVIKPDPILDATYNTGRIWAGTRWPVTSMDIDPQYGTDIVADNREMPGIADESYAVVVYDPPHVGPQEVSEIVEGINAALPRCFLVRQVKERAAFEPLDHLRLDASVQVEVESVRVVCHRLRIVRASGGACPVPDAGPPAD